MGSGGIGGAVVPRVEVETVLSSLRAGDIVFIRATVGRGSTCEAKYQGMFLILKLEDVLLSGYLENEMQGTLDSRPESWVGSIYIYFSDIEFIELVANAKSRTAFHVFQLVEQCKELEDRLSRVKKCLEEC